MGWHLSVHTSEAGVEAAVGDPESGLCPLSAPEKHPLGKNINKRGQERVYGAPLGKENTSATTKHSDHNSACYNC